MDEREAAVRDLERIRTLMERAGRYSNLSGFAAIVAGALAAAGALLCRGLGIDFNHPAQAAPLALVWGSVFLAALAQAAAFTVAHARRRAEPAWSPLARQAVSAMLPAAFVGAAVTGYGLQTGQLDLLPPIWMLAHGSSLMGLWLFSDWRIGSGAALFLLAGSVTLFGWKEHGLVMLLASFGGIHVLLGALMLWKPRP